MLALGFSEDEDVMIGNARLVVKQLKGPRAAKLRYETEHMDKEFDIVETRDAELSPYVVVSVGLPKTEYQITLCFDAPRNVQITRGSLYRKWGNSHSNPNKKPAR